MDRLERFDGVMIFISDRLSAVDYALQPYIKPIALPLPSAESIKNVLAYHLHHLGDSFVGAREEVLDWVTTAVENSMLSVQEVRKIYRAAVQQALTEGRELALKDILREYTAETGRHNEWDVVSNMSLYGENEAGEGARPPEIAELLPEAFGPASIIPDDARLCLTFSESFFPTAAPHTALRGIMLLSELTKRFLDVADFQVVDWGWPKGLWAPMEGCAYQPRTQVAAHTPPTSAFRTPQQRWDDAGFTFGLRHLIEDHEHGAPRCGKPWRRLVYGCSLPSRTPQVCVVASHIADRKIGSFRDLRGFPLTAYTKYALT